MYNAIPTLLYMQRVLYKSLVKIIADDIVLGSKGERERHGFPQAGVGGGLGHWRISQNGNKH